MIFVPIIWASFDFRPYQKKSLKNIPAKKFVWKRSLAPHFWWYGMGFATWQLLIVQLLPRGADVTVHVIKNIFKLLKIIIFNQKNLKINLKIRKKLLKFNFRPLIFFNLKIIFFSSYFKKKIYKIISFFFEKLFSEISDFII